MTAWQWVGLFMAVTPFVVMVGWLLWIMTDEFGFFPVLWSALGTLAVIAFVEAGAMLAAGVLVP